MTNEDFDRIWSEVEWRDLNPVQPGFNEALRHRFARAIIAQARAETLEDAACWYVVHGWAMSPDTVPNAIRALIPKP